MGVTHSQVTRWGRGGPSLVGATHSPAATVGLGPGSPVLPELLSSSPTAKCPPGRCQWVSVGPKVGQVGSRRGASWAL